MKKLALLLSGGWFSWFYSCSHQSRLWHGDSLLAARWAHALYWRINIAFSRSGENLVVGCVMAGYFCLRWVSCSVWSVMMRRDVAFWCEGSVSHAESTSHYTDCVCTHARYCTVMRPLHWFGVHTPDTVLWRGHYTDCVCTHTRYCTVTRPLHWLCVYTHQILYCDVAF